MRADLHMHSVWSDGALAPSLLAARAKAAGLDLFSLTDHDTMGGNGEAAEAARSLGLAFLRGWEISAYEGLCKVHVLGYGCADCGAYRAFLRERFEGAAARAEDSLRKGNACFGLSLTMDDVERYHVRKSAPVHTMHVVSAFAHALGRDKGELYTEFFEGGKPAHSALCRPTPFEAVKTVHACGGIAVLAHPGRIRLSQAERETLTDALCAAGLDGIECVHPQHTERDAERFAAYAQARGLLVTGGSDFHADDGGRAVGMPPFEADERLLRAAGLRAAGRT